MIEIAGGILEGGGQIVRTAVGLSAVTGRSCRITDIRRGRKRPGLAAQHTVGIEAAADLCNGAVEGARIGSTEIVFRPGEITGGRFRIDIGTAGSVALLLQTLVLPSIHADREVDLEITGGTHVRWSPTIDYFREIFCDFLLRMGIEVRAEITRAGFYPKGGGRVRVTIRPVRDIRPLNLTERGDRMGISAGSIATRTLEKARVAERQVEGAERELVIEDPDARYADSHSIGSSIHLTARYTNCRLGASVLGERGKPAEKVGKEAARLLTEQIDSGACLDRWMADQLLPYLALARGASGISVAEITSHCLTSIHVIETFLPVKFEVSGSRPGRIVVKGIPDRSRESNPDVAE